MLQRASSSDRTGRVEDEIGAARRLLVGHLVFAGSLLILYHLASLGAPICFDDCISYAELMGKSGADYLHTLLHMFRPWAVPSFFSLFGSLTTESASRIVFAQTCIAFFSWLLFAYACRSLFETPPLRLLSLAVCSLSMFGQGYYRFNQYLLSDSLALSSVLIQWSLILFFPAFIRWSRKRRSAGVLLFAYLTAFVLVSAFEMATRDANIMIALAGSVFLLWATPAEDLSAAARLRVALCIVALAIGQATTASNRHILNANNILTGAVLPNAEVREYFLDHGMPAAFARLGETAKAQDLGNIDIKEMAIMTSKIKEAATTPEAQGFITRIDGIYARYLVTHPGYVIDALLRNWRLIFCFTLERGPRGLAAKDSSALIHPGDSPAFLSSAAIDLSIADHVPLAAGITLFAASALLPWLRRSKQAVLPLLFAGVGTANAVLAFFGDVWERSEMTRHAAIGSVMLRCGLTLCALMLVDEALRRAGEKWPDRFGRAAVRDG